MMHQPPRLARLLLRLIPTIDREFVEGDLEEEYADRAARLWLEGGFLYWLQAIRRVGGFLLRPLKGGGVLDQVRLDVLFGVRTLLRSRSFLVGALSLAVTIGATTAVYGTADWLLRKPMGGIAEPDRLVTLQQFDNRK